jgi:hypothetical protein
VFGWERNAEEIVFRKELVDVACKFAVFVDRGGARSNLFAYEVADDLEEGSSLRAAGGRVPGRARLRRPSKIKEGPVASTVPSKGFKKNYKSEMIGLTSSFSSLPSASFSPSSCLPCENTPSRFDQIRANALEAYVSPVTS